MKNRNITIGLFIRKKEAKTAISSELQLSKKYLKRVKETYF